MFISQASIMITHFYSKTYNRPVYVCNTTNSTADIMFPLLLFQVRFNYVIFNSSQPHGCGDISFKPILLLLLLTCLSFVLKCHLHTKLKLRQQKLRKIKSQINLSIINYQFLPKQSVQISYVCGKLLSNYTHNVKKYYQNFLTHTRFWLI